MGACTAHVNLLEYMVRPQSRVARHTWELVSELVRVNLRRLVCEFRLAEGLQQGCHRPIEVLITYHLHSS